MTLTTTKPISHGDCVEATVFQRAVIQESQAPRFVPRRYEESSTRRCVVSSLPLYRSSSGTHSLRVVRHLALAHPVGFLENTFVHPRWMRSLPSHIAVEPFVARDFECVVVSF